VICGSRRRSGINKTNIRRRSGINKTNIRRTGATVELLVPLWGALSKYFRKKAFLSRANIPQQAKAQQSSLWRGSEVWNKSQMEVENPL